MKIKIINYIFLKTLVEERPTAHIEKNYFYVVMSSGRDRNTLIRTEKLPYLRSYTHTHSKMNI